MKRAGGERRSSKSPLVPRRGRRGSKVPERRFRLRGLRSIPAQRSRLGCAGSEPVTAMKPEETGDSAFPLQGGNIDVEIHPVDALNFQRHMLSENFGDASWYAHFGSGTTPILRDRLPLRRPNPLARTARSSSPSTGAISRIIRYASTAPKYILSV